MNITLLETNKKKLKSLRNRLQLLASNFNDEIRILMDERERLDKTSMSIDGNNLHIAELDHLRHRIQFLQSHQAGLQEILVSI